MACSREPERAGRNTTRRPCPPAGRMRRVARRPVPCKLPSCVPQTRHQGVSRSAGEWAPLPIRQSAPGCSHCALQDLATPPAGQSRAGRAAWLRLRAGNLRCEPSTDWCAATRRCCPVLQGGSGLHAHASCVRDRTDADQACLSGSQPGGGGARRNGCGSRPPCCRVSYRRRPWLPWVPAGRPRARCRPSWPFWRPRGRRRSACRIC